MWVKGYLLKPWTFMVGFSKEDGCFEIFFGIFAISFIQEDEEDF